MADSIDVTRLQEATWCRMPGLTREQAVALERLGMELSAADKDTNEATSLIQCRYTTSGVWEVRVSDAIGLVGAGSESWPVDPKIAPTHLLYLFQRADVLPRTSSVAAEMASGKTLWHLIYEWFLQSTEVLVRSDLAMGYSTEVNELPYVRGTVDTLNLSRGLLRGHTRLRCSYEEFTPNISINRVLKAALLFGLASGTMEYDAARRTRRLLARFSEVGIVSQNDLRTGIDRHTSRYRDSLMLALHILRGVRRELSVGSTRAWCFLWRTPKAVEDGIRHILHDGVGGISPVNNESKYYAPLSFKPDLTFGGLAIGDVKYSLDNGGWRRDDVYQLLAFSVAHSCDRALLVNFCTAPPQKASASVAGTLLERLSWRLDLPPHQAGELLVEQTRTWLTSVDSSLA